MRNYWLRIVVGAVAIFTVGMIGVSLARQGVGRVRNVVEGSGPISVPVAFIPFKLNGQKLGKVSKIVLQRDAPKQIASVELQITLPDSALARGLSGCRLAANIDKDHSERDAHLQVGPLSNGVFTCLGQNDTTGDLQDFGHAVFEPGHVTVPLLLPKDIADDLQQGNFGSDSEDSISDRAEAKADSIAEAADQRADSIAAEAEKAADLVAARKHQLVDSLRREGARRADSARGTLHISRDTIRRH
jgi:hypothetical protein